VNKKKQKNFVKWGFGADATDRRPAFLIEVFASFFKKKTSFFVSPY
jgi:hypothetical protein